MKLAIWFCAFALCVILVQPAFSYTLLYEEEAQPGTTTQSLGSTLAIRVRDATYFENVTHIEMVITGYKNGNLTKNYPFRLKSGASYYGNGTIDWDWAPGSTYSGLGLVVIDITDYNRGALTLQQTFTLDGVPISNWNPNVYSAGFPAAPLLTNKYSGYLQTTSGYIPNGTYSFYGGAYYTPVTGNPISDFTCNADWDGEYAPFNLACTNTGTNYTEFEGGCSWTVYYPNSSTTYSDDTCSGFSGLGLVNPGRYSVGLQLCNDVPTCDFELKNDYVLILPALVLPNVTPTIYPNVTQVPMIPTFSPTLQEIVNRSEYRSTIEETLIGNITAPYLDFVDGWADSWISWVDQLSSQLNWPIIQMTDLLEDVLEQVQDSFDSQYAKARVFLYWIGAMLVVIPASVWTLINYKLLIEILKAFMET